MKCRPIYILGGMGPQASVYFYQKIINLAHSKYGAENNDDYPEINIHSIPVPDFISDNSSKPKALEMLVDRVKSIDNKNYGSFAIACNTVHLLVPELIEHTQVQFISMVDEVAMQARQCSRVGIMATPTSLNSNLYQQGLDKLGIDYLTPNAKELEVIESAIRSVIQNENPTKHRLKLRLIARRMLDAGADKVIIGCSELPIVYGDDSSGQVIDSVSVLCDVLLKKYYL